jgi:hypothetical protein
MADAPNPADAPTPAAVSRALWHMTRATNDANIALRTGWRSGATTSRPWSCS